MKVTWLGQAGAYVESGDLRILIDPYFSDAVGRTDPAKKRRMPPPPEDLALQPDVLIFTHDHLDHYDPETAAEFLSRKAPLVVLCPSGCWHKVRQSGGGHNYVLFDRGTQWTEKGVRFTAVPAAHSDPAAIGVLIQGEDKLLYLTGDTLYREDIFRALPEGIDAVMLPINGAGNNMNVADAARFARRSGAKIAIPIHWGMFDGIDPEDFPFEPKQIPKIYQEILL